MRPGQRAYRHVWTMSFISEPTHAPPRRNSPHAAGAQMVFLRQRLATRSAGSGVTTLDAGSSLSILQLPGLRPRPRDLARGRLGGPCPVLPCPLHPHLARPNATNTPSDLRTTSIVSRSAGRPLTSPSQSESLRRYGGIPIPPPLHRSTPPSASGLQDKHALLAAYTQLSHLSSAALRPPGPETAQDHALPPGTRSPSACGDEGTHPSSSPLPPPRRNPEAGRSLLLSGSLTTHAILSPKSNSLAPSALHSFIHRLPFPDPPPSPKSYHRHSMRIDYDEYYQILKCNLNAHYQILNACHQILNAYHQILNAISIS
jgi:hypothetical protein